MHDYIGWLIGGIAIVITVAIYFKQQGIIDNLQKTEQSLKSNSLKILNYYIETCGISLGKTASSVKADILNDRLTLDELKEVLKTDEYYFRMTDIMNKELAFVRPRISIGLHQIFYRAIDGLSSLHDPEKIDNYNNPKIWLNEIIEVLTPAIADAREKLETELKQMELKPNLLDGTHKLKNRCSLK
ncbi:MAG TPA: hypothetical protein VJ571_06555, partial [Candidatus Nitrosotalea sp.]|nr:hypothetical protein [Candidatus Nitrosotalea sp.]